MRTKSFSINARIKSFDFAFSGVIYFFKTEHNAWIHFLATITILMLALIYKVSNIELLALVFVIGLVFITEALNTAIEKLADFVSATQHPQIKIVKDVAAAAVLFAAFTAFVTGLIIFIPKIFSL